MKRIFKIFAAVLTLQAAPASQSLAQNIQPDEFAVPSYVPAPSYYLAQKDWINISSEFESGDNPFYASVCTKLDLNKTYDSVDLFKLSADDSVLRVPHYCQKNLVARKQLDVQLNNLQHLEKSIVARAEILFSKNNQGKREIIDKTKSDSLDEIHRYVVSENIALKIGYAKRMHREFFRTFPNGISIRSPN